MDFGQWSALMVLVGTVLVASTGKYAGTGTRRSWQRDVAYFGTGVLVFGLVSCVLVAAGASIHFS